MVAATVDFKDVKISESIRADATLVEIVERATDLMRREIATSSAGIVTLEWNRVSDEEGRSWIELTLSDGSGSVLKRFAPDDLNRLDDWINRWELQRLWSELLQVRSHRQLEHGREVVSQLEGD